MKNTVRTADYWIENLGLEAHTEGGYFKEIYANPHQIDISTIHDSISGSRPLATSIYFLITDESVSRFHRLKADEMWYYHDGCPLTVYMISPEGKLTSQKIGLNVQNDEIPQLLVPAGTIFGSCIEAEKGFSFVGCMVAFGFHYEDFELFGAPELIEKYPEYEEIILKLT